MTEGARRRIVSSDTTTEDAAKRHTGQTFGDKRGGHSIPLSEFFLLVQSGRVPGHLIKNKFGRREATTTAVQQPLWGGATTITFPTVAAAINIVSDDANDTLAGTGTQIVTVEYLDAAFDEQTTTIELDGLNPVVGPSAIRINDLLSFQCGTGRINAGLISASIGGNEISRIEISRGRAEQSIFTVPNNFQYYLYDWFTSQESSKISESSILVRDAGCDIFEETVLNDGINNIPIQTTLKFNARSDILLIARSLSGTFSMSGALHGMIGTTL